MAKVLIIEDDRTILEMYRIKFVAEGFTVYTATNGEEGLKVLTGTKPDIILLDLMMPVMDGATMLEKLRKQSWGKNIPVILLTNVSQSEIPESTQNLAIADYIVKAESTPHIVLEKVRSVLKNIVPNVK